MSEHVHDWTPVEGQRGRYTCGCGAQGWRAREGIRVAKTKYTEPPAATARPSGHAVEGATGWSEQWRVVGALPSLDETEGGRR